MPTVSVGQDKLDISSKLQKELQKYAAPKQAAGGGVRRSTIVSKPLSSPHRKANAANVNGGSFRNPFNDQAKSPTKESRSKSSFTNTNLTGVGVGFGSFTQPASSKEKDGLGRPPTSPSASPLTPHSPPLGMRSQRASISALMLAGIGGGNGIMSDRRPTLSASIMSGSVGVVGAANLTNTSPRSVSLGTSAGVSTEAVAAAVAATASAAAARMTRVSRFDLVLEDDLPRLFDAYCAVDEGLEGALTADEINEMCSLACVRYDPGMVTKSLELYRHHASLHNSGVVVEEVADIPVSSDDAGHAAIAYSQGVFAVEGCLGGGGNNKQAVVANSSFSVRSPRVEVSEGISTSVKQGQSAVRKERGEKNVCEEERVPFFELFCTLFPSTSSRAVGNAIRTKMAPSFVAVLMPSQSNVLASPAPAASRVPQPPESSPRLIRTDPTDSFATPIAAGVQKKTILGTGLQGNDGGEHPKGPRRGVVTRSSPDRRQLRQTKTQNTSEEASIAPEPPEWIKWLVKECREVSSPSETRIVEALALAVKERNTRNGNTKEVGKGISGEGSTPTGEMSTQSTDLNKNGRTLNVSGEESHRLRGIITEHLSLLTEDVRGKSEHDHNYAATPTLNSLVDSRAAWYDPLDPFDTPSVHINALWRVMCLAENKRALCASLIALEEERDTEYVAELLREQDKGNNRKGEGDASQKEQFLPLSAPVRLSSESLTTASVANVADGRAMSTSFSSVTACSPPRASRARGPTAEPPMRRSTSTLTVAPPAAKDTVTPARQTKGPPPRCTSSVPGLGDKVIGDVGDSVSPAPQQSARRGYYGCGPSSRSPHLVADTPLSTRGHQHNLRDEQASTPILRARTEVTAANDSTSRASKPHAQESAAAEAHRVGSRLPRPLTYYLPTLAVLPSITKCEDPSANIIFASSLAQQEGSLLLSPSGPPFWVTEAFVDERKKRGAFSMDADRLLFSPQQCSGKTLIDGNGEGQINFVVPPPTRTSNPYAASRTGPGRIPEATLVELATRVSVEMYVRLREDRTSFRSYRLRDILKHCRIPDVVIAHLMSIREPTFVCLRTLVLKWETLKSAIESAVRTAVADPIMCRVPTVRRSPTKCSDNAKDKRRQPHSKQMGLVSSNSGSAEKKPSRNNRNGGLTPDGDSIMRRIPTAAPNTLVVSQTSANKLKKHGPTTEIGIVAALMASTRRASSPSSDSFLEKQQSSTTSSSSLSYCQGADDAIIKENGSSSQIFPRRLFSDSSALVAAPPATKTPFSPLSSLPSTYVTSAEVLESLVMGRLYAIVSICRRFGAMAVMRQLWDETLSETPWPGHNSLALQAQQPVDRAEGVPPRPPISVANLVLSSRQITEMFITRAADQAEGAYFTVSSKGHLAALSRFRPPLPPCAFTASEVAAVSGVLNVSEKKFPAFGTVGGEFADLATAPQNTLGLYHDGMKKKRLFLPYPTHHANPGAEEICATHRNSRSKSASSDSLGDTNSNDLFDGDCDSGERIGSLHLLDAEEDLDHSSFFLTATGALLGNNKITDNEHNGFFQTAVADNDLCTLSSEPDKENTALLISGSGSSPPPSHPPRASPLAVHVTARAPNEHNNKIPLAPSIRSAYPLTENQQEHTAEHFSRGGESQRSIDGKSKEGNQGLVVRRFHPLSPRHSFTQAERTQRRVIEAVSALTTPNSIPHSEYLAAYGRTAHYTVVSGAGRDATVVRPKNTDGGSGANAGEIDCDTDGEDCQTLAVEGVLSPMQTSVMKAHARRGTSSENEYQLPQHYSFSNQAKRRNTAPASPEGRALSSTHSPLIRSLMPASRPPPSASNSLRPRSASIPTTAFEQTKENNEGQNAQRRTSAKDSHTVSQWPSARQPFSSGLVGGPQQSASPRKSSAALASAVMKHVVVNANDAERQFEDYLRGQRRLSRFSLSGRSSVDAPRYTIARARFDCLEDPFPQPAMCPASEGDSEEVNE